MLKSLEYRRSGTTRARAYAQVHELAFNTGTRIPFVHAQAVAAARSYVKGWTLSPFSSEPYNMISLVGKK